MPFLMFVVGVPYDRSLPPVVPSLTVSLHLPNSLTPPPFSVSLHWVSLTPIFFVYMCLYAPSSHCEARRLVADIPFCISFLQEVFLSFLFFTSCRMVADIPENSSAAKGRHCLLDSMADGQKSPVCSCCTRVQCAEH